MGENSAQLGRPSHNLARFVYTAVRVVPQFNGNGNFWATWLTFELRYCRMNVFVAYACCGCDPLR